MVDFPQDLVDALPSDYPAVDLEVESRDLPDAHLTAEHGAEVRRRGRQRIGGVLGKIFVRRRRPRGDGRGAERGVEDARMREIAAHVDAGERDQLEPGVVHPLELLGEHLEHRLIQPGGAGVPLLRPHHRVYDSLSSQAVSTSSSSTSGAATTKRSTDASTSRTCDEVPPMTATPIDARCHWSW